MSEEPKTFLLLNADTLTKCWPKGKFLLGLQVSKAIRERILIAGADKKFNLEVPNLSGAMPDKDSVKRQLFLLERASFKVAISFLREPKAHDRYDRAPTPEAGAIMRTEHLQAGIPEPRTKRGVKHGGRRLAVLIALQEAVEEGFSGLTSMSFSSSWSGGMPDCSLIDCRNLHHTSSLGQKSCVVMTIWDICKGSPNLEELHMGQMLTDPAMADYARTAIEGMRQLRRLYFGYQPLLDPEPEIVNRVLQCLERCNLTCLDLSMQCLHHYDQRSQANLLSTVLGLQKQLCHLNLRGNNINTEGAASLASALKRHESLQWLHLGHNCIGDGGCIELCLAAKECSSLTGLNLSWNAISNEGSPAAINLRSHPNLIMLDLTGNRLSEDLRDELHGQGCSFVHFDSSMDFEAPPTLPSALSAKLETMHCNCRNLLLAEEPAWLEDWEIAITRHCIEDVTAVEIALDLEAQNIIQLVPPLEQAAPEPGDDQDSDDSGGGAEPEENDF